MKTGEDMIKRIMVRSLAYMYDFIRNPITMVELDNVRMPVAIISIRDVNDMTTSDLFAKRDSLMLHVLPLYFEDEDFDHTKDYPGQGKFSAVQARRIIPFIRMLDESSEEFTLIVHCVAGISRSGAIGEVVADLIHMRYVDFKGENPQVIPNTSVKLMMRRVIAEEAQNAWELFDWYVRRSLI
jgi:predicted protein tyrosine phosphatase